MLIDLPCLRVGYDALKDGVEALVSSGLVERQTRNFQKSKRSYFRISQAYYDAEASLDLSDRKSTLEVKNPLVDSQRENPPFAKGEKTTLVSPEAGEKATQDRNLDRMIGTESTPESTAPACREKPFRNRLQELTRAILTGDTPHTAKAEILLVRGEDADVVLSAWGLMLRQRPKGAAFFDKDYATEWKAKAVKLVKTPVVKPICPECGHTCYPTYCRCGWSKDRDAEPSVRLTAVQQEEILKMLRTSSPATKTA